MALSNQAFNVREQKGGKGERGAGDRKRENMQHMHKTCHHYRHFKSLIMHLFVTAYFSKFNLGQELEQAPESKHTGSYPSPLCKMQ